MKNDRRITVIADDITGAAEIAGIAHHYGLDVRLLDGSSTANTHHTPSQTTVSTTNTHSEKLPDTTISATNIHSESLPDTTISATNIHSESLPDVIVIATDTRSMTEEEAVAETQRVASSFLISHLHSSFLTSHSSFKTPPHSSFLTSHFSFKTPSHSSFLASHFSFKKTDSALRGHVVAELTALMQATGYRRAVWLPANPSKGRVIRDGIYYIHQTPIHETDFSFDPEFPARTSSLRERFPDAERGGIIMPDALSTDDIRQVVSRYADGHTLFAGAADLFEALLHHYCPIGKQRQHHRQAAVEPMETSTLILCGSTQSRPLDLGIALAPMPRAVYDGSTDLQLWDTTAYEEGRGLILTIPHTHRTGREVAVHLRTMMAAMAARLVARHHPGHLIIEGGATAWATIQAIGWSQFKITRQFAPGVVQMRADDGTLITLKPGSYPWGGLFD